MYYHFEDQTFKNQYFDRCLYRGPEFTIPPESIIFIIPCDSPHINGKCSVLTKDFLVLVFAINNVSNNLISVPDGCYLNEILTNKNVMYEIQYLFTSDIQLQIQQEALTMHEMSVV
jgi:hypothetical protein